MTRREWLLAAGASVLTGAVSRAQHGGARMHHPPQSAEELAGPAVFLASPSSDFVTGETIRVDGGYAIC